MLTTKIRGCHFILQVKFYTRPTKYKTILLIADSEKNNKLTLELLLLKYDVHFSFVYEEGLVSLLKNT